MPEFQRPSSESSTFRPQPGVGDGPERAGDAISSGDGWLSAGIHVLGRLYPYGGTESRTEDAISAERDHQAAVLSRWADAAGLWVPEIVPGKVIDAHTREHYLFSREDAPGRVFKITRSGGFGFFPRCDPAHFWRKSCRYWFKDMPATPLEYFQRLSLSNTEMLVHLRDRFPVLNRLEGFVIRRDKLCAVTSQPVFAGRPAQPQEIADWFRSRGFSFIRAWTWFRPQDGLAVFDTWMDNVMECGGELAPFDVIPVKATGLLLEKLREAADRVRS